jgi:hypothetical protein
MPSFTANFQTLLIMTGRVRLYSSITFLWVSFRSKMK